MNKQSQETQINHNQEEIPKQIQPHTQNIQNLPSQHDPSLQQNKPVPIPTPKNVIHLYKGDDDYEWKLEQLDPTVCIQQLQVNHIPEQDPPFGQNIEIKVKNTRVEGTGLNKHTYYIVFGHDTKGNFQSKRRYSEYLQLRKKLTELWIGIFMPILPSGSIGNPQEQVLMRIKYLNNFWHFLSFKPAIIESAEVQQFLRNTDQNIDKFLQNIKTPKINETLKKYKKVFSKAYQTSLKEQFLYNKDKILQKLQRYEQFFCQKKITLSEYEDSFYRLADLKTRYFKSINKLEKEILPQYQDVISKWFSGESLKIDEPGIMEKLQIKTEQAKKLKELQLQPKNQEAQNKPEVQLDIKNTGLFTSQAFQSRFEDLSSQAAKFNTSTWLIYDVLKFQLKEIDMVTTAIEQLRNLHKESAFFRRSIDINKEEIQSLNNNKKTLKTFLMGGTQDDKKTKLSKQSTECEYKLQQVTELQNIVLVLIQEQIQVYHQARVKHYHRNISNALIQDIKVARILMELHIFQSQLFAKQKVRRIKELIGQSQDLQQIKE